MLNGPESAATEPKKILNHAVNMQESLSLVWRFKAQHLSLLSSSGLVGDLRPIVRVSPRIMSHQGHDRSMCHTVTSKLVRDETKRFPSLTFQQSLKEPSCGTSVPTGLDEDVDHVAVLVHNPPEVLPPTVDGDEQFVQIPCIAETTLTAFQPAGVLDSEFDGPLSDRFISHVHATLSDQIFDLSKAQAESIV